VIVWNPLAGAHLVSCLDQSHPEILFDLLDDWTIHPLFESIRSEVRDAYAFLMKEADRVTANSEGTIALASRHGRKDAILIPNGCDVGSFSDKSRALGPITIGYGGKLGFRIDTELVMRAASSLPQARFVFAGPVLDSSIREMLRGSANIAYLGDLVYHDYVQELTRWDVAWIPHRVGHGEVGGDVIKQYEYRAAGLPTFSTPLIGMHRSLPGVRVIPSPEMVGAIQRFVSGLDRVPREPIDMPTECTWSHKAGEMLRLLGCPV
jgi:hypothetical protein